MDQNKLDQFFRDKLSPIEPRTPSSKDWAAAKVMLDLSRKKDDRATLFWLLLLGIFNVGFTYLMYPNITPLADSLKGSDIRQEMAIESTSVPNLNQEDEVRLNTSERDDSALSRMPELEISNAKIDRSDAKLPVSKTDLKSVSSRQENQKISQSKTQTKEIFVEIAQSGKEEEDINPTLITIDESESLPLKNRLDEMAPNKKVTPEVTNSENLQTAQKAPHELIDLEAIDNRVFALDYQYGIEITSPTSISPIFIRPTFHQTRYGWTASILLNPANTLGSPVQGVLMGFAAEYFLTKKWAIGSRPSVQVTMNESGFSKFQVHTSYSFSAISQTFGLQASSLQFVRVPAYLAWINNKHTIEGGLAVDWLVGARGQVQQVEVEGTQVELINPLSSGWIDTDQMKQFSTNIFFGYKFSISNRVKTGMTLFYNPGKIYPGLPNKQGQLTDRKWFMGLQAIYYVR